MVAKIAVSAAVFAIDKPYSYKIPPQMAAAPGMRVMVPFGRGNRRTEGIILAVEPGEDEALKCIDRVLDTEPVLNEHDLRLAAFVRERAFCTFYDAIKAMLPAGLWFHTVDHISIADVQWRDAVHRQPTAVQVMERLEEMGGGADYGWLRQQFPDESQLQAALRYLQGKKLIECQTDMFRKVGDKTERMVELAVPAEEALSFAEKKRRSAPMQASVLELLCAAGSGCTKDLCYLTGCTGATLRRLEDLGYLRFYQMPVLRCVLPQTTEPAEPIQLTAEQQTAFDGLCAQWDREKPGAALLYGVTGSGKTAVYLRLISRCLEQGRTALVLVPEIALTPQLLHLFAAHFGQRAAVLHSALRVGERYDTWKRIRDGGASVVIGTRSAVFAPLQNLGLLIVDEEQEHTYKSENAPRYHAREVALYRGFRENALVVLGSATPSVETMFHAREGHYGFYTLTSRFNGRQLPRAQIVDMKQELRAGNGTSISRALAACIQENLEHRHQTILFLNRRGASRCLVCVECGAVPQCPRCSVNLTYHAANHRLMCHYCGHSEPAPDRCPDCGGSLKPVGAGTQKVEEELTQLFPEAPVLRMDTDSVSAVNTHEKLLARFEKEQIPLLIGTQMVAKGLNFENVTLVGVLDADMSLYVENFRAAETTFAMITQVVGRSGRGAENGRALIQTMTPENAVITLAAAQDYDRFYDMEIALRQLRGLPPFRDMFVIQFCGAFEAHVLDGARRFGRRLADVLRSPTYRDLKVRVLGPAPAAVAKVNNRFYYRLTMSCANTRPVRQLLAYLLREFAKDSRSKGVHAFADVNPYD